MMIIPTKIQPYSWAENDVTGGHVTSPHFPMIPIQKK